jgi:hypothetical protein
MMTHILLAAAVLTEASAGSTLASPARGFDLRESEVVVEASNRPTRRWAMTDLGLEVPAHCPSLIESPISGFGRLRVGLNCAQELAGQPGGWSVWRK